jgi:transposase
VDEIISYFTSRRPSGIVEGVNNKINFLKRRCHGTTTLTHLFQPFYLDLEECRLFGLF